MAIMGQLAFLRFTLKAICAVLTTKGLCSMDTGHIGAASKAQDCVYLLNSACEGTVGKSTLIAQSCPDNAFHLIMCVAAEFYPSATQQLF